MRRTRTQSESGTRPVGIWIRVSTEDQARGESPEHHEKRARFYAESKGWTVVETYHLEGVSGKSVLQHPEAQRMLADMRRGRISGLIFSKLARLARNTKELLDFADEFESHGADLVSLQESIDTSTPAGRLFYTIIAAMAQWEREEIADRVAASVPVRAKLGKSLGGAAPFGYRWQDGHFVADDKEAPIRKLLFELFIEHRRKGRVARMLNEAGYRTRRGEKFTVTAVQRLLTDPIAKGSRRTNYTRSPLRGGGRKAPKEWVYVDVPAIVPEALWDEANEILQSQRTSAKQPSKKTAHLFSGFVECRCGVKMYVPSKTKSYACKKCKNRIREDDLEIVFNEQLKGFLFSTDQINSQLEKSDDQIRNSTQLLATLEAERERLSHEMNKLYDLYIGNHISGQLFAERNEPLEERRRQLDDEVPRLAGEIDYARMQLLSSTEVISEARDLHTRWPKLLFDEKRQIIEGITDRIIIDDNEITIALAYLTSAPSGRSKDDAKGSQTLTGV